VQPPSSTACGRRYLRDLTRTSDSDFSISARRLLQATCQPSHAGVLADRLKSRLAKPGGVLKC
jgi:hypothetical protein